MRGGALALLVALAAAGPYVPTLWNEFDNDDAWNALLECEVALDGGGSMWSPGGAYLPNQNVQRVLPVLTYLGRYVVLDVWMPGWRAFQIALHMLTALLVVALIRRLGVEWEGQLLGGMLFALGTLPTQPVVWVGGTYDLLVALGLGLALIGFSDRQLWVGLAGTAIAFCSKESGVFVVPALALWALSVDGWGGWKPLARRLAPYVGVVSALGLVRGVQLYVAGDVASAGLPIRTIAFDAGALLLTGPYALLASLATAITTVRTNLPLAAGAAALVVLGLAATRRSWAMLRPVAGLAVMGWAFLVPVLLMVEDGAHQSADLLYFNSRYLYVSSVPLAAILPWLLFGPGRAITERSTPDRMLQLRMAFAACLISAAVFTGWQISQSELREDATLREVRPAMMSTPPDPGRRVFVLINGSDVLVERFLLSGWWHRRTQAEVLVANTRTGQIVGRRHTARPIFDRDGDNREVRPYAIYDINPSSADQVWVVDPTAEIGARVTLMPDLVIRRAAQPVPAGIEWQTRGTGVCTRVGANGTRFVDCGDPSAPTTEGAEVRSQQLGWLSADVNSVRVRYTLRPLGANAAEESTRLRLLWRTAAHDVLHVSEMTLTADGKPHEHTLLFWLEPTWNDLGTIEYVAIQVAGGEGELILHGLERFPNAPPGGFRQGF